MAVTRRKRRDGSYKKKYEKHYSKIKKYRNTFHSKINKIKRTFNNTRHSKIDKYLGGEGAIYEANANEGPIASEGTDTDEATAIEGPIASAVDATDEERKSENVVTPPIPPPELPIPPPELPIPPPQLPIPPSPPISTQQISQNKPEDNTISTLDPNIQELMSQVDNMYKLKNKVIQNAEDEVSNDEEGNLDKPLIVQNNRGQKIWEKVYGEVTTSDYLELDKDITYKSSVQTRLTDLKTVKQLVKNSIEEYKEALETMKKAKTDWINANKDKKDTNKLSEAITAYNKTDKELTKKINTMATYKDYFDLLYLLYSNEIFYVLAIHSYDSESVKKICSIYLALLNKLYEIELTATAEFNNLNQLFYKQYNETLYEPPNRPNSFGFNATIPQFLRPQILKSRESNRIISAQEKYDLRSSTTDYRKQYNKVYDAYFKYCKYQKLFALFKTRRHKRVDMYQSIKKNEDYLAESRKKFERGEYGSEWSTQFQNSLSTSEGQGRTLNWGGNKGGNTKKRHTKKRHIKRRYTKKQLIMKRK